MRIFAIAKQSRAVRSRGGERRPSNDEGIFYVHTSETCQRSHYTISGGHPVDIRPWTKSRLFSDREGCRFPCLLGKSFPTWELHIPSMGTKTAQGGSLYAKQSSNMQQLTLQFEGFADTQQHIDVGTTKRRISEAVAKAMPVIKLSLQSAIAVAFAFSLMFFAAIIGG